MHSNVSNLSAPSEDSDAERSSCSDSVVIVGDLENQEEVQKLSLRTSDLWALGISIALGGQYIGWNKALSAGFGSTVIATFLIASGYWCLILCIAEVSSAIPFGGTFLLFFFLSCLIITPILLLLSRRVIWHSPCDTGVLSWIFGGLHGVRPVRHLRRHICRRLRRHSHLHDPALT